MTVGASLTFDTLGFCPDWIWTCDTVRTRSFYLRTMLSHQIVCLFVELKPAFWPLIVSQEFEHGA